MRMLRGKLKIALLCACLMVGVLFLWAKTDVDSESAAQDVNELGAAISSESKSQSGVELNQGPRPNALTQRVTNSDSSAGIRIPSKPRMLELAVSASQDDVQQLVIAWPELKEQMQELRSAYAIRANKDEDIAIEAVTNLLKGVEDNNAFAVDKLRNIIFRCEDGYAEKIDCEQVNRWVAKQKESRSPSLFERLEKQAVNGDVYAQYLYTPNLQFAVGSREVNTARDIQLWMERRQRMIEYLVKFAKAGDVGMQFYLAATFEGNYLIKSNPFWSAVFFKQVKLHYGEYHPYENLVELHELDEALIEKARQSFFDS
ncbi:hypothetical protein [uncultured Pseudoteredinibacter sp.]|uniref:hypothetical protein n=1 Tax=uncultured Pseudoteredinibacter sp. TaxID=1641701 RepID=UPI00262D9ED9|nr:hypothetical protein [uncultured Pseudoteredinibacter sp.]